MTRTLPRNMINKAFWRAQAQRFLNDFIWNDGDLPASGKIVLKKVDSDASGI
jgi:hypothetical protein